MATGPRFHTDITANAAQYNAEMEAAAQKTITDGQRMQSGWRESVYRMGQDTAQSVKGMNSHFDSVEEGVKAIRGAIAAVTAALGGGVALVKFTNQAADATRNVENLARMLGITTQEATALLIALGDIEVKSDSYTAMVSKLVTKLREGEEGFNRMGVVTRGAGDKLLDTQTIIQNALRALLEYKEGTDRNLASSVMFGRGWEEVNRLMRLTPEVMEEARRKAEELQTEVGPAGAERARVYKLAMNDLKDVYEALVNRIGQALMPVLSDLANWFSDLGPAAVTVLRGAIGGLLTVFYGLRNGVIMVWEVIKALVFNITEPFVAIGEAVGLALSGNFEAAGKRIAARSANISARWKMAGDEMVRSSEETAKRISELFDFKVEQGAGRGPQPKGTKTFEGDNKGQMAGFEAELAARRDAYDRMRLAQGSFQTFSKAQERDYWAAILASMDLTNEDRIAVLKKFYEAERDLRKQAFDAEIGDLKLRIEKAKEGSAERIALAIETAKRVGEKFGLESKEYKAATAEVIRLAEERRKQQEKLAEMVVERQRQMSVAAIELEREMLEQAADLGQVTAEQKLTRLRQLKEMEFQIELQAEMDKALIYEQDVVQYQAHLDRIEQLKEKHRLDMAKVDGQIRAQSMKVWKDIGDAITGAFSTAIKGVIMGTQTLSQAVRNMGQNILLAMVDMAAKWLAQQAVNAIIGKLIEKESAVSRITANAAVAASGAAASVAAIPFYGWAMAAPVAASTFAATQAWVGAALSAARGYDIPRGVNPITQLHQEEMVLPAHLANLLREQLTEGGGMGGDAHLHVHAAYLDRRALERMFSDNGPALAKALREQVRNFTPMPRK